MLILKEPDFGSALILLPIYLAIVFCAGLKWRYIIFVSVASTVGFGLIVANEVLKIRPFLKGYQLNRILAFLHPEDFLASTGYQPWQAYLAVASGGLTGKGIGEGTQNSLGFLPQMAANNDFIFSIIAEETGFIGCALIFLAYLLLLYSILRTAFLTDDPFGRYLCIGIAAIIFTHCFINIGMSIGLTPVTRPVAAVRQLRRLLFPDADGGLRTHPVRVPPPRRRQILTVFPASFTSAGKIFQKN